MRRTKTDFRQGAAGEGNAGEGGRNAGRRGSTRPGLGPITQTSARPTFRNLAKSACVNLNWFQKELLCNSESAGASLQDVNNNHTKSESVVRPAAFIE